MQGHDESKESETRGHTRLPDQVVRLGWISLFADICSEMSYPIMPLFVTGVLKAPIWVFGMIEGIAESIVSLMKGWSGFRSDQIGKRTPLIRWGYLLSALGKPIVGLASGWPGVLVGRSLDRFGKGIRTTPRDAMIAESSSPEIYGRAFGFHRAMDTTGALVGVVIALALIPLLAMRSILILALVPGLAAVLLAFRLKEVEGSEAREDAPTVARASIREVVRGAPRGYWQALLPMAIFALANTSDTYLLLRAKELGLSDAAAIAAYLVYNVVVVLVSTPMGILSDRIGRGRILLIGFALYACVYAGFGLSGAGSLIWVLFGFYGLYYGMTQGVGKALVASCSPTETRGSSIGLFYLVCGIATLVGNAAIGWIWTRYSSDVALWTAAGAATVACLMVLPIVATESRSTRE